MRILFLYGQDASFVRADLTMLRRMGDVTPLQCGSGVTVATVARALLGHDAAFVWFGLGHASRAVLAGRLLGKRVYLVGGGWDVAVIPEIGYGAARTTYGRTRAAWTFGLATRVLAFSDWSRREILAVAPRARVETVYLGVDTDAWRPAAKKETIILTVGQVVETNLQRKGLMTFAEVSRYIPSARFVLVGKQDAKAAGYLRQVGGPNLEMPGELSEGALHDLAGKASVYVQVSYTEGFGLALAEAMSAECVPVVTQKGAIPEVVGPTGIYVSYGDPVATAEAIKEALRSDLGARARARIEAEFPLQLREEALKRVVATKNCLRG